MSVVLTNSGVPARWLALSVRHVTGKPIKFAGVGEKREDSKPSIGADGLASTLGMGDVLASLIEDARKGIDEAKAVGCQKTKSGKIVRSERFQGPDRPDAQDGRSHVDVEQLPAQFARVAGQMPVGTDKAIRRIEGIV